MFTQAQLDRGNLRIPSDRPLARAALDFVASFESQILNPTDWDLFVDSCRVELAQIEAEIVCNPADFELWLRAKRLLDVLTKERK